MAAATVPDRLEHIQRSIDAVLSYWQGKSLAEFQADEMRRAATERHLEIISEASRHLPDDEKRDHPQIPWRDIAAIGNILRHRYDIISDERIWEIVTLDLPALRGVIDQIVAKHERRSDPEIG